MIKTEEDFKKGQVLLIDKPLNWTSFQVVNKLRWEIRQRFNIKKIKVLKFDKIVKFVFDGPHQFLYLKANEPENLRYYKNFDKIILDEE